MKFSHFKKILVESVNYARPAPNPGEIKRRFLGLFLSSHLEAVKKWKCFRDIECYFMFLGYPRSGHSLVGAIIDAHPNAICAHELNTLRYIDVGFNKRQIFSLILRNSLEFARHHRPWTHGHRYGVPGQWQGRFSKLKVIGDKKGGASSDRLSVEPRLLDDLKNTVNMPVKFIHVVRNPFDNISSMVIRSGMSMDLCIQSYFDRVKTNAVLRKTIPENDWIEISHEDLVANPRGVIGELCRRLGLEAEAEYIDACAALIRSKPHQSRKKVEWTPDLIQRVNSMMEKFNFLQRYSPSI